MQVHEQRTERQGSCLEAPRATGPATVLVVDDNADLNSLLCERLGRLGFETDGACTGEDALAKLVERAPDLVFLDVSLPGISGLDVLAWIRSRALDTAVIMTTAFGSERVAIDALRRGADDYLPKVSVAHELEAILERTVARQRLNRNHVAMRKQLDEKRAVLEAELGQAARVQAELLPAALPQVHGFELAAMCIPAHEVGGDFYDWQQSAPGIFNVTLCDVMGKGMPAALLMATVRATLRAVVRDSPPGGAMRYVVSALAGDLNRSGSLVTMFLGQLDAERRTLRFVDAGHGHVFLQRASGEREALSPRGLPLGVLDDATYEEGEVRFEPGDALVLYSDGLIDAQPHLGLGPEQLSACVHGGESARVMVDRLLCLGAPPGAPADDLTVVVVRRTR
jgi:phosphoserine phosphatase RsbU/P